MADLINDNKTISRNNAGFPEYLDFDALRSEAIQHLGNLSGKIWTDHNVHDPGITILEALIYALLDLGYRSNLPAVDIFSRNPSETGADNNFLTPAQILGCNPLTITDFRKLLADLPFVRNAWLEPADDVDRSDFCYDKRDQEYDPCCEMFINGLYHVYVELERFINDETQRQQALQQIKDALMKHRNLCEDFIDIKILCRKKVGVCAELELENGTDVEKLYFEMINAIQQFLSPAPKFYTLQQLLDKDRTISEIYAGRPLEVKDSHGFLDTEEFENIRLKKSIHLSDIYGLLLQIKGVRKVKSVDLRTCDGVKLNYRNGSYLLPEFHIPELDLNCSGFRFYRDGVQLSFDTTQLNKLLELGTNAKLVYKAGSVSLDAELPKGVYRADLDEYYSIQNEFPRVYGIGEGDLADNVTDDRKAKALQLKGFLLFFDQMLANYLSQLKNIRSLFALSVPSDAEQQHTYFVNKLSSVPDLKKLLRFPIENEPVEGLGNAGSILAFPFSKSQWVQWEENDELKKKNIEKLEPFAYQSIDDRKTGVQTWINDVYRDSIETTIIVKDNDCVYFYLSSPSNDFVFISKRYYKNEQEARNAAATILYLAGIESNYRSYFIPDDQTYTFNLELNLANYGTYLQDIAETAEQYAGRRRVFLRHLLARFSEQFTDYALLSYGFLNAEELEKKNAAFGERLLSNYGDISSNRGRAYDYVADGWNNNNISGFEKRFKHLSGIEDLSKHSLCNFEVSELDAKYVYGLQLGRREFFAGQTEYHTQELAAKAAQEFFNSLADAQNYSTDHIEHDKVYAVQVKTASGELMLLKDKFETKEEADKAAAQLPEIFGEKATAKDVFISSYQYHPKLRNNNKETVRAFASVSENENEIRNAASKAIRKISDPASWKGGEISGLKIGKLLHNQKEANIFLDLGDFKIDVNNTIEGKPELFSYELLDRKHQFKFRAVNEFENDKAAQEDSNLLLQLLLDTRNLDVVQDPDSQKWQVQVNDVKAPVAVTSRQYATKPDAEKAKESIQKIVDGYRYHLGIDKEPYTYKFVYQLGYGNERNFRFNSEQHYYSEAEAITAAQVFIDSVNEFQVQFTGKSVILAVAKNKEQAAVLVDQAVADEAAFKKIHPLIDQELIIQKDIHQLRMANEPKSFMRYTEKDSLSRLGQFVYRLVDKDGKMAMYVPPFTKGDDLRDWQKQVVIKSTAGYQYLQICLRGDNVVQRTDSKSKEAGWFYQLKASGRYYTKGDLTGQEIILFESINGYASADEAAKAFDENYLAVLQYASDKTQYGKGMPISFDPSLQHMGGRSLQHEPIVFVPKATMEELGADENAAVGALADLAMSYPIRRILYDPAPGSAWNRAFACNPQPELPPATTSCEANAEHWFYYFALTAKDATGVRAEEWRSTRYYSAIDDASKDLEFVLLLLKYDGNYTTDCSCDGTTHVYLREVLAQSIDRFPDRKTAWGPEGVEKFICVSQKAGSFHNFQEHRRCCYSFYVACENSRVKFGCSYDTARQRDEAIDKLYGKYSKLDEQQPFSIEYVNERYALKDEHGKVIARVTIEPVSQDQQPVPREEAPDILKFCRWRDLIVAIDNDNNYYEQKGGTAFFLADDMGRTLAGPVDQSITLDQWKAALRLVSAWYRSMINVELDANGQPVRYCIQLDKPDSQPKDTYQVPAALQKMQYECTDEDDTCNLLQFGCCFVVEKNEQGVEKIPGKAAKDAMQYLLQILGMLKNHLFYQRVFDCVCEGYRIQLHGRHMLMPQPVCLEDNRPYIGIPDENRIIAYNPNCYPHPEQACDSVIRAKKLINNEGLHLVEHILLRPRCVPGNQQQDCGCELKPNTTGWNDCEFPYWKRNNDEDPCDTKLPVCFVPGSDPYSFIATVIMPAWPERFRKKENRAMLEMMLHREAPAHVLLRVLWLAPHDFCCIEQAYKSWNHWLAKDDYCYDDNAACKFIDLLFNKPVACLDDCNVCEPCSSGTNPANGCEQEEGKATTRPKQQRPLGTAINKLFDWKTDCQPGYAFEHCDKKEEQPQPVPGVVIDRDVINEVSVVAKPEAVKEAPLKKDPDHVRPESKQAKALREKDEAKLKAAAAAKLKAARKTAEAPEKIAAQKIEENVDSAPEKTEAAMAANKTVASVDKKEPAAKPTPSKAEEINKARKINARHNEYKKALTGLAGSTNNNPVVRKALRFLDKTNPSAGEYNTLLAEVFTKTPSKSGKKKAEAKWADDVAAQVTLHFLDALAFEQKDLAAFAEAKPAIVLMKKAGMDTGKLFKKWESGVQELEPAMKTAVVKKVMQ